MKSLYRLSLFCLLSLPVALPAQLVINEFSASNKSTTYDQFGDAEDWIELFNPTNTTVNLNGWYLSDDPAEPTKWAFPSVSLAPGKHLLI
ncbi:MAG TPA: lamin tail domain-containing protein, partial [Saprospiraceae bacterium]|nr:lamin tail domain-containing protein [Saprospiraceae bacterium]